MSDNDPIATVTDLAEWRKRKSTAPSVRQEPKRRGEWVQVLGGGAGNRYPPSGDRAAGFAASMFGGDHCSCHIAPPCGYCTSLLECVECGKIVPPSQSESCLCCGADTCELCLDSHVGNRHGDAETASKQAESVNMADPNC